jgi:hypothetical protein
MSKEYKFNKKDTTKYLYKILFELSIYFVILLGLFAAYKGIKDFYLIVEIIGIVLIVWGILFIFPLLLLYFNHRFYSKTIVFTYDEDENNLTYHSSKKEFSFTIDDIEKVELYLTPNAYEKFIDWQYFGKYHYSKIYTKTNEVINISCLVCDEIEDIIPEKLIKKKKKYIPIIE